MVPHLHFLFSIIHVDARPIVQGVYKNIINVHFLPETSKYGPPTFLRVYSLLLKECTFVFLYICITNHALKLGELSQNTSWVQVTDSFG